MPQSPASIGILVVLAVGLFAASRREPDRSVPVFWLAVVFLLRFAAGLAAVAAIFAFAFDIVWVVRH